MPVPYDNKLAPKVNSGYNSTYARYLGYKDGRQYGHKNPTRSFDPNERTRDTRTWSYYDGLDIGTAESRHVGLDTRCLVHWDNPTFDDSNACCGHATHVGIVDYGSRATTHVLTLCDKHARVMRGNRQWVVLPIGWF
jgi:hypothetical protein